MDRFEVEAGDVVLLEPKGGDQSHPISQIIQVVTGSAFSHSMVVVNADCFADALVVEGGPDIRTQTEEQFSRMLSMYTRATLLRPTGYAADEQMLAKAVQDLQDAASGSDPSVRFDVGVMGCLGILRLLQQVPKLLRDNTEIGRLRLAILYVSENGPARLFCSEFSYRVLSTAGQQPQLPAKPVVPIDDFPMFSIDEDVDSWLDMVWRWIKRHLRLSPEAAQAIEGAWSDVKKAFRDECRPSRIELANYFTPEDFARSPSLQKVATRTPTSSGWVPEHPAADV